MIARRNPIGHGAAVVTDESHKQPASIRPIGWAGGNYGHINGRIHVLADPQSVFVDSIRQAKVRQPGQRSHWPRGLFIGPKQPDVQPLRVMLVGLRIDKQIVVFRDAENKFVIEIRFGRLPRAEPGKNQGPEC